MWDRLRTILGYWVEIVSWKVNRFKRIQCVCRGRLPRRGQHETVTRASLSEILRRRRLELLVQSGRKNDAVQIFTRNNTLLCRIDQNISDKTASVHWISFNDLLLVVGHIRVIEWGLSLVVKENWLSEFFSVAIRGILVESNLLFISEVNYSLLYIFMFPCWDRIHWLLLFKLETNLSVRTFAVHDSPPSGLFYSRPLFLLDFLRTLKA